MDKRLFQSSYFDMIILKLLSERDMYGYEIIEEISSRSQNACDIKAGTLYPILASLTEQGCIEPYEKTTGKKRIRKYYKLTPEGMKALSDKKESWNECYRLVNCFMEG